MKKARHATPEADIAITWPEGWELSDGVFMASDAKKMLTHAQKIISAARRKKRPIPVKFHATRNPATLKRNQHIQHAATEIQTGFPHPMLAMPSGRHLILPTFRAGKTPVKLDKLTTRSHSIKAIDRPKRATIAISKQDDKFTFKFGKILHSKEKSQSLQAEIQAAFRLARDYDYISRPYKIEGGEALIKEYLFFDFWGTHDGVDYMYSIPEKTPQINLRTRAAIAMLLETICIQNMGIWHRDIKLENFMFIDPANPDEAKLIDFEDALPAVPGQEISFPVNFGTLLHHAPELFHRVESRKPKENSGTFDDYAVGFTICRLFYPQVFSDDPVKEPPKSLNTALHSIADTMSDNIADLIDDLTQFDPTKRITMQEALEKLQPNLVTEAMRVKRDRIVQRLHTDCAKFPAAAKIVVPLLHNLPPLGDFKAFMNSIFRLQMVNFYMQLFRMTSRTNAADIALFTNAITAIYAMPDKDVKNCIGLYFKHPAIETRLQELCQNPRPLGPVVKRARMN